MNQPAKLSRTPAKLATATPERGEHTDEVLLELGFGEGEIAELRATGWSEKGRRLAELIKRRERRGRPDRLLQPGALNAMTYDMWRRCPKVLAALDADPAVRVVVLAGDGDKAFISGADISQFEKLRGER